MSTGKRILEGLRDAVSCRHDWRMGTTKASGGYTQVIWTCPVCNMRKSVYTKPLVNSSTEEKQ